MAAVRAGLDDFLPPLAGPGMGNEAYIARQCVARLVRAMPQLRARTHTNTRQVRC